MRAWESEQLERSRWGRPLPTLLVLGVLGACAVITSTFVRQEALPAGPVLVVPTVLLLLVGQVSTVTRLRGRTVEPTESRVRRLVRPFGSAAGMVLAGVAVAGVVAAWSGLRLGPGGTPARARLGCPYPLVSRGHVLCVSPQHYRLAGLGTQRFAAGVVLLLLAIQLAVVVAQVRPHDRRLA